MGATTRAAATSSSRRITKNGPEAPPGPRRSPLLMKLIAINGALQILTTLGLTGTITSVRALSGNCGIGMYCVAIQRVPDTRFSAIVRSPKTSHHRAAFDPQQCHPAPGTTTNGGSSWLIGSEDPARPRETRNCPDPLLTLGRMRHRSTRQILVDHHHALLFYKQGRIPSSSWRPTKVGESHGHPG